MTRLLILTLSMTAIIAVLPTAARAATPLTSTPLAFGASYRVDDQTPFAHGFSVDALSCPTTTSCVALDDQGNLLTTTDPTAPADTWSGFNIGTYGESDLACPTASLCVAFGDVDGNPTVDTSSDPTGGSGAWQSSDLPGRTTANFLTCPTANFCAALGADGTILTTEDPAGGAGTWTSTSYTTTGQGGESLTCASASLCLIGTTGGTVYSSTDPSGGVGSWTASQVAPIGHFSCPTVDLCVGVGFNGFNLEVSTDPAGGAGAWTETALDSSPGNGSPQITCTSSSFCVALSPDGSVASTNDPEGGASAWSLAVQTSVPPGDTATWSSPASCPDAQFCLAGVGSGDIAVSTDPAGPSGSWPSHSDDGYNALTGVSCVSEALCVAVDDAGNVLTSAQPELPQSWAASRIDDDPLTDVACTSGPTCVAVDRDGDVLSSSDPAAGASAWTKNDVDAGNSITAVSCAPGPVCMAVDDAGNTLVSTDPTGGASTWQVRNTLDTNSGADTFTDVSCADATLCVASSLGSLEIAEDPGQPGAVWKAVQPPPGNDYGGDYSSIACPSAAFCIAAAGSDGLTTDDPTGNADGWASRPINYYNSAGRLTCESSALCLSYGEGDAFNETSDPTGDYTDWGEATPDPEDGELNTTGASCPSSHFCIVVGNRGEAWAGEDSSYTPPPPSGTSGVGGGSPTSGAPVGIAPSPSGSTSGSPAPATSATPAPHPSAPASRSLAPGTARVETTTITIGRARPVASLTIHCPAGSTGCAGTISLSAAAAPGAWAGRGDRAEPGTERERALATGRYDVPAGQTATVSLQLSRRAVTLLSRRPDRRLSVTTVLRPTDGHTVSFRLELSLKPLTPRRR